MTLANNGVLVWLSTSRSIEVLLINFILLSVQGPKFPWGSVVKAFVRCVLVVGL